MFTLMGKNDPLAGERDEGWCTVSTVREYLALCALWRTQQKGRRGRRVLCPWELDAPLKVPVPEPARMEAVDPTQRHPDTIARQCLWQ